MTYLLLLSGKRKKQYLKQFDIDAKSVYFFNVNNSIAKMWVDVSFFCLLCIYVILYLLNSHHLCYQTIKWSKRQFCLGIIKEIKTNKRSPLQHIIVETDAACLHPLVSIRPFLYPLSS